MSQLSAIFNHIHYITHIAHLRQEPVTAGLQDRPYNPSMTGTAVFEVNMMEQQNLVVEQLQAIYTEVPFKAPSSHCDVYCGHHS